MISLCACTPSLEVDTIEVGVVRALCIDERERVFATTPDILLQLGHCPHSQHYFLLSLQSRHLSFVHAVNRKPLSTSSLSSWSERYSYTLQWNAAFATDAIAAEQIVTVRAIVIGMSVVTYESSVA